MRILYHHRTLADGAEGIHIDEMVHAFRALGHQVRVAGLSVTRGAARRQAGTRVKALLPGFMFELASMAVNLPEYMAMRRTIREFQPDLVYKRHARYDIAAVAAARRSGVPTVLEVNCVFSSPQYHRFEPHAFSRLARWFEWKALACASVVLTVSTPLAKQVEETGMDRMGMGRVVVIPNGADPDRFDPGRANPGRVRDLHRLGDAFTVGWTGILREWHGLELLLEAIAPLSGAQLLIVGDGPARPLVEARAATLGLEGRMRITGRVPFSEMPDYLAAMDACVVADERTGVASPMKLLEYMAMARAVVAPALDNIRDSIDDGVHGLLFAAGDSGDMRRALERLAGDAPLRQRLGQQARTRVVVERNWRRNAETVVALVGRAVRTLP